MKRGSPSVTRRSDKHSHAAAFTRPSGLLCVLGGFLPLIAFALSGGWSNPPPPRGRRPPPLVASSPFLDVQTVSVSIDKHLARTSFSLPSRAVRHHHSHRLSCCICLLERPCIKVFIFLYIFYMPSSRSVHASERRYGHVIRRFHHSSCKFVAVPSTNRSLNKKRVKPANVSHD